MQHLRANGHAVNRLVRSPEAGSDAFPWNPSEGAVDQARDRHSRCRHQPVGRTDLALAADETWQEEVLSSRLAATTTLATAIARAPRPPALLSASGMSAYGDDRGDEVLTESSSRATGSSLTSSTHGNQQRARPPMPADVFACCAPRWPCIGPAVC